MKLIALAMQAQNEPDARQVLGDAVLESGWWDGRVMLLMFPDWARMKRGPKNLRRFRDAAARPTANWVRAVLAVLLFEGWQDTTWSTWQRAKRPPPTPGEMAAILRRLWPQRGIAENLYAESPFFQMIRRAY